jgi:chemotaxis protein MotB
MKQGTAMAQEKKPRRRVKKVKGHGGHHGGAWKVAYADFVTAMMALFLVLWLVSQADIKLKESIANYFRAPGVFNSVEGGILSRAKNMSKEPNPQDNEEAIASAAMLLRKKFQKSPEFDSVKDQVKIEITDEGLRIQILDKADQVSFASGSAQLTDPTKAILNEISQHICDLPNSIYLGGHTDRAVFPAGATYTNWELSADRANAARRYFEHNSCIKAERISRVVGYADTELLYPGDPYAPGNRRISITLARLQGKAPSKSSINKILGVPEPKTSLQDTATDQEKPTRPTPGAKPAPTTPMAEGIPAKPTAQRLSETKLKNEGAVPIGEPDTPPPGVRRTKAH